MAKSKQQQLQDLKQKEHDRKYGRTAKKNKKKDPEAPYSDNPTPGHPGWNLARGPNNPNET